ncbi:MAG: hypothetical protein ABR510_11205 [Trueperaceae bacterium]
MLPYLLASFPTPRLGQVPELTLGGFLEACGRMLDEPRFAALVRAVTVPPLPSLPGLAVASGSAALPDSAPPSWPTSAESVLAAHVDDAVVRARCVRQKRDPEPFLRHPPGLRVDVEEAVARAFAAPHPGLRERALDELRWRLADELARSAPDGFAALYAYAVQLRLAWRWVTWDAEAGWRAFEAALRVVDVDAGTLASRVHDA